MPDFERPPQEKLVDALQSCADRLLATLAAADNRGCIERARLGSSPAGVPLRHITVGHGRDYSDVAPIVGRLKTTGGQVGDQSVDVVPVG